MIKRSRAVTIKKMRGNLGGSLVQNRGELVNAIVIFNIKTNAVHNKSNLHISG